MDLRRGEGSLWSLGQVGGLLVISFLTSESRWGTIAPSFLRQSWFMTVVPGKLLIASRFSLTGVPFCMINYTVALG